MPLVYLGCNQVETIITEKEQTNKKTTMQLMNLAPHVVSLWQSESDVNNKHVS